MIESLCTFSSNINNNIPITGQVGLFALQQVTFGSALPEDVQTHLPRSCRDQVSPSVLRQSSIPTACQVSLLALQ